MKVLKKQQEFQKKKCEKTIRKHVTGVVFLVCVLFVCCPFDIVVVVDIRSSPQAEGSRL